MSLYLTTGAGLPAGDSQLLDLQQQHLTKRLRIKHCKWLHLFHEQQIQVL